MHVNAEILNLPGISGHADKDHLTAWVQGMKQKPKRVFVVHGQDQVTDNFAAHLKEVVGVDAVSYTHLFLTAFRLDLQHFIEGTDQRFICMF